MKRERAHHHLPGEFHLLRHQGYRGRALFNDFVIGKGFRWIAAYAYGSLGSRTYSSHFTAQSFMCTYTFHFTSTWWLALSLLVVPSSTHNFDVKHIYSKKECLIPLTKLLKSPDFLADDCCVFGVDILKIDVIFPEEMPIVVQKNAAAVQNLFIEKLPYIKWSYSVTIDNFLEQFMERFVISKFELDGQKWYFGVYPCGNRYSNNCLSLFLHLDGSDEVPHEYGKLVELTLSILDKKHGKHFTRKCQGLVVFAGKCHWGWSEFIPLTTLFDPSRGYLVGSSCTLKAEMAMIGSSS